MLCYLLHALVTSHSSSATGAEYHMMMHAGLSRPSLGRSIHSWHRTRFSMILHPHVAESSRKPASSCGSESAGACRLPCCYHLDPCVLSILASALLWHPQQMMLLLHQMAQSSWPSSWQVARPCRQHTSHAHSPAPTPRLSSSMSSAMDEETSAGCSAKPCTLQGFSLSEHWKPPLLSDCWMTHSTSLTDTHTHKKNKNKKTKQNTKTKHKNKTQKQNTKHKNKTQTQKQNTKQNKYKKQNQKNKNKTKTNTNDDHATKKTPPQKHGHNKKNKQTMSTTQSHEQKQTKNINDTNPQTKASTHPRRQTHTLTHTHNSIKPTKQTHKHTHTHKQKKN